MSANKIRGLYMYCTRNVFNEIEKIREIFNENCESAKLTNFPLVNLYENGDKLEIKAVLPGIKIENLNLELVENSLVINGERNGNDVNAPYLRRERSFGEFRKAVRLPYRVDREKVKAALADGILSVELVRSEEAKPKKIEIR
jgi:HSP20 family protein